MKFLKLLLLVTTFINAGSGFKNIKSDFMSAEDAFKVTFTQKGDFIETKIILADKIHLTADTLKFLIVKPEKLELNVVLPKAHELDGDMVYQKEVLVKVPLKEIYSKVSEDYTLAVQFSGCSDKGICYNP